MRKNLPSPDLLIGKTIEQYPNYVIQECIGSGNNGLLFRAYNEATSLNLAFKFVPVSNLPEDKNEQREYLNEAKKANMLDSQHVVVILDVFLYQETEVEECVVFVSKYINGENLRDYIKHNQSEINVVFIETYLRVMFELLYELQERQFQHGDLHAGNVLVTNPEYDIHGRPAFRVTDFGVRELTGQITHASDFLNVAGTLRLLLGQIKYNECEGRDRYIYNILKNDFLSRHLIEIDISADTFACNPRNMMDKLNSLEDQYRKKKEPHQTTLNTPFDYPNCEQIGNSHLLLKNLYSNRLLGLSEIEARSNLILTGPRGCGKTTVFRALSLEYLISTEDDNPKSIKYIGIYYRCDDLYFNFPRYKNPERTEALNIPLHFFTVTLLSIALEQISIWAKRHFEDEFQKKEEFLAADLWELFGWQPPNDPSSRQLATLITRLKGKERRRAANKQRVAHQSEHPIQGYFDAGVMFDACCLIRNKFSFLHDRHLYFFIDDYSQPKITKDLQMNLNRLLMHRNSDLFFKLSTESPISFVREDIDGKKFIESREYDLFNLGLRYISSDTKYVLAFLEDLFDRRFNEVENYPIKKLRDLLGMIPRNENDMARTLREKQGKEESYAGVETIAAMCSGDVHYMIRLVRTMIEDYGGVDKLISDRKIPPSLQHRAIRRAAAAFIESVRTFPRRGPQLANIISAFGNVAHSYLIYETSANEQNRPPHQASRIEPYEPLEFSDEADEILKELLRYSIFIEDPRGKSRRGKIVPRFYLRRYLIPHFQLTFSRRDSLSLENAEFETLLLDPGRFEERMRLRSKRRRRRTHPDQQEFFEDE